MSQSLPPSSRRRFVSRSLLAGAALALPSILVRRASGAGIAERYSGLKSNRFLGKATVETTFTDEKVFTEGPAVDRAGNVFLTNVPVAKILKWNPLARKLSVFRENSHEANGLLFEPDGSLLACEGGAQRVTRTDMETGKITVLAGAYHKGSPIGKTNDLTRDRKGRIYFTARFGNARPTTGNVDSVYRVDPDGKLEAIMADPQCRKPNGVVLSPDEKTLYLIEAHPLADHPRNIQAFDLGADGRVSNQRTLIDFYPGRSGDGMCVDSLGNLYVAAGLHKTRNTSETLDTRPGIHVISPKGDLLAYRETPEDTITNCTFGGEDLKTLYVACGTKLLSLRTKIAGKASYRPNA